MTENGHFVPNHQSKGSMRVFGDRCRQCQQCIQACPTHALRVHGGVPTVLSHLCIDCTACIEACPAGAIALDGDEELSLPVEMPLLMPPAGLFQFGAGVEPERVLESLSLLGFSDVRLTTPWEEALTAAVDDYSKSATALPVISTGCLVVTNLIQLRFPSLINNVAPFLSALESAVLDLAGPSGRARPLTAVVCPGQRTALINRGQPASALVTPRVLRRALGSLPYQASGATDTARRPTPWACKGDPSVVKVSGLRHVMRTLEDLEKGILGKVRVLELDACMHGCFGSGVLKRSNPVLAAHLWRRLPRRHAPEARVHLRDMPLVARPGLRIDSDMSEAIRKLSRIDQISRSLPDRNCGQCGAPTCRHFAEDVALNRADLRACVYLD